MATSYNGWPASRDPKAIGIDPTFAPCGHRFPGGVKRGDVATLLAYVVEQLDARVEPIDRDAVADEWGYVYKASANSPNLLSCHSSGTAIDYNATRHPNGVHGTWTPTQVTEIRRILAECSGAVRWLGDATGKVDAMHFEIRGDAAAVARAVAALPSSPPTPVPQEDPDMPANYRLDTTVTVDGTEFPAGSIFTLIGNVRRPVKPADLDEAVATWGQPRPVVGAAACVDLIDSTATSQRGLRSLPGDGDQAKELHEIHEEVVTDGA